MNCGQAEKWMDAALDELSGGEYHAPRGWSEQRRAELEAHFGLCSACRSQWDLLRSAEIALRVPKPVTAPDSLLLEFRQRLAAEAAPAPRRMPAERPRSPWAWIWPLGSVAAAGAAAATVLMFNVYVAPVPTPSKPPAPLSDAATSELFGRPASRFSRAEDQVRELKPRATSDLAAKPAPRVGPPALAASGTPAPLASLDSHVDALAAPHASTAASDLAVKPEKKSADQPAVSHVASAAATPVNATLSLKQLTQTQAPPAAAPSAANGQFNRNLYRYQLGSKMQVASDRLSLLKEKEAAGQATLALGIVPPDAAYYSRPSQNWALYGTDAAQVAAFRVSQNANLSYT
ncbi:MAG: hypothetical protein K0Q72_3632, partial [Armatimonadetes bacterium]|nr:hypothetical protein [Armatimonadota bacterium]